MSKVFIFDPDSNTQESIREVLEVEGHEVRGSNDATIALKRITAWIEEDGKGPDIILVEFFASDDDPQYRGGGWLAHELKRCGLTQFTPLVIMCAKGRSKSVAVLDKVFRERYGAAAFLPKPFNLGTVRDAINGLLWAHTSSRS
jgi:CheY-like chemotaxis protein